MELGNEVLWKRYLRLSVLMMVLCASQHKQLTITLIIFAAAAISAGVLIFLIGHVYNLTFHGVWSFHTGSMDKIDSTLLYTVTEEDAELFVSNEKTAPDDADNLRELFLSIEEELTGQQLRYVDFLSVGFISSDLEGKK